MFSLQKNKVLKMEANKTIRRQCPVCLKVSTLVKHHWYNDNTHTIGHIRLICNTCNRILRNMNRNDGHILPEWDKQVEYVQRYTLVKKLLSILRIIIKENAEFKKPYCPRCGSIWRYYRKFREEYICRLCTHIWIDNKRKQKII